MTPDVENGIAYDAHRKSLYVDGPGKRLSVESNAFIVSLDRSEPVATIPEGHLETLVCVGPVSISAGARENLLTLGISTTFLSSTNRYLGSLFPSEVHDAEYLLAQVDSVRNKKFAMETATSIVRGKIQNMRSLLMRFSREEGRDEVARLVSQIDSVLSRLNEHADQNALLGAEGSATASYYEAWQYLLPEEFSFNRRIRRPAPDPVNALLSLGGSVLTGLVTAGIASARLVPTLSYLHSLDGTRPSLAFDLVEEFRAPVVEQLALELLRRGTISSSNFETSDDDGLYLAQEGRRIYFASLESRLRETFKSEHLGRTLSYREAIDAQAEHLSRCIRGVDASYIPIEWST